MKKNILLLMIIFLLVGCSNSTDERAEVSSDNGVFYEIFVRSFADSDGDGIGDFNGITENLDYLVDLGVKGIWLLPIYPSPSYHGYDVTDYYNVNSEYGTLDDFKKLVSEAHNKGIKVVLDMVLNHASSEHPWFIDSKENIDSDYADYFIWADANDSSYDFSASPIDGKAWSKYENRMYFGAFWSGMPDWNASNNKVREEFINIGQYWIDLGVDGFRLDAAKYLYAQGEYNTDLNLLQENLDFWKEITDGWREAKDDLYIVAEVWSGSSSVAPYYSNFDANFNFDLADAIVSVVRRERDLSGFGLMKNLTRMHESFEKYAGDRGYSDAIFLTNHDQDRVMSVLNNDMDLMKLAADIYLMLPGNPYIYYGEEIGMLGRKPDEDIRFPLKWGNDYETEWRKDTLNMDLDSIKVQLEDKDSLLNHYKSLIAVRNSSDALSSGEMVALSMSKSLVIGQIRYTETEAVFILHNISERDCEVGFSTDDENLIYSTKTGYTLKSDSVIIPSKGTMLFSIPVEEVSLYEELEIEIG